MPVIDKIPQSYEEIAQMFGNTIISVTDQDYSGDTRLLLQSRDDWYKVGYLNIGWGSCPGCDALQACDSAGWNSGDGLKDAQELVDELEAAVMWFDSYADALKFFKEHDWEGSYNGRDPNNQLFVKLCIQYLEYLNNG